MTENPASAVQLAGGAAMPLVGFGTWQMTGERCYDAVRFALQVGYRHIDTATMYHNETEVGRAVRDSGVRRDEVFVTTKLPPSQADRVEDTLAESLDALGFDQVDLWLIHWPPPEDPHAAARTEERTDIDPAVDRDPAGYTGVDVWHRFIAARESRQARAIGVSNYSLDQLDHLSTRTGVTPEVNQIRWAPALYDPPVEAGHRDRGVVLEGYSPFKSTDLDDPVLREIAQAHAVLTSQVVLRWHLEHGVVVIPKSENEERIIANLGVTQFTLTPEEVARIDALAAD
jgi:2,5-diketo-D-gluconate reductase A